MQDYTNQTRIHSADTIEMFHSNQKHTRVKVLYELNQQLQPSRKLAKTKLQETTRNQHQVMTAV